MQTSHLNSERRSAKRHKVRLSVEMDLGSGVTRDFSLAGLYLLTDRPLSVGELLQLSVAVPDPGHPGPIRVGFRGRVVRVEDAVGTVGAGIALERESLSLLRVTP